MRLSYPNRSNLKDELPTEFLLVSVWKRTEFDITKPENVSNYSVHFWQGYLLGILDALGCQVFIDETPIFQLLGTLLGKKSDDNEFLGLFATSLSDAVADLVGKGLLWKDRRTKIKDLLGSLAAIVKEEGWPSPGTHQVHQEFCHKIVTADPIAAAEALAKQYS